MYKDDIKLVKRVLNGDRAAFEAFYNSYFPKVFRFCALRVDNPECCKDIVQQSLTSALKALESYRGEATLHTWICQICRNEISAWYKKSGTKQALTSSIDSNPDLKAAFESIPGDISGHSFDEAFDIKSLVVASLDSLPPKYGRVLELKYMEGLSVAEMAKQMSTTEIAIQSLLARARIAFREVFTDLHKEHVTA